MTATLNSTGVQYGDSTQQNTAFLGGRGQVFTGNGTFTIPTGITAVKVTVVGGGGGGGGGANLGCGFTSEGVGGASAAVSIKFLSGLTPGNTLSVTVGGGGTAGSAGGGTGGTGGTSTVASGTQAITSISATGGGGGSNTNNISFNAGGTASGGDLSFNGAKAYTNNARGGQSNIFGQGGTQNFNAAGSAGLGYGAGGGGGAATSTLFAGGAGSAGVVVFEW